MNRIAGIFLLLFILSGCAKGGGQDCVPLPSTQTPDPGPATATPYPAQKGGPDRIPRIIETPTPIPFVHQVDLSPNLPMEDKSGAIVYRCNGTWDLYYGDPVLIPTAVPLSDGDIIYSWWPPLSLKVEPPEPPKIPISNP